MTDSLAIGIVRAPHGVKGELRVQSYSGSVENWGGLREACFRKGTTGRTRVIISLRPAAGGALMTIEGCDTREKALALVGEELWAGREFACTLAAEEYYTADLCRCGVFRGDERVGEVRSIVDAGPNQLLEILTADGRAHLIPFTDRFFGEVDVKAGRISLREEDILR